MLRHEHASWPSTSWLVRHWQRRESTALARLCGVGEKVKASASRAAAPGFKFRLRRDLSRWIHTSDLEIGSLVTALPGVLWFRVSAGTGWPGDSILWLGEIESLICNFCLSVAECTIVWADPSQRCTSMGGKIAVVLRNFRKTKLSKSNLFFCFFLTLFQHTYNVQLDDFRFATYANIAFRHFTALPTAKLPSSFEHAWYKHGVPSA